MTIIKTTSLITKVSILSISCTLIGGTSAYAGKLPADVPEYPSYPRIMVLGKAKASKEVEKAKQEAQKKKEEDAKKAKEAEEAAKAAQQKKIEEDKLADQARKEIEAEKKRLEAQMRKEELKRKAAEAAKAIAAEEARVAAQVEKAKQELEARKRDEAIKAAEAEKAWLAEEARRLAAAEAEKARLAAEKKRAEDARVAEAERLQAEARRAVSRDPVQKTAVKNKTNTAKRTSTVRRTTVVKKKDVAARSTTYRKRSGVSTVSKGSTNQEKQIALHDHYAKWVSSYVGGHIGRSSTADQGGVDVGVFGGRNWRSDKIVYGIEGGVSKSNSGGSFAQNGSYDAGWSATVRVRGGYLVTPDTLLYATAGVAWTNFDINAGGREVSDTYAGFVIGAGLEHQFNDSWSARAEYTYTDYGSTTYQHNGQAYTFDPETHAFRVAVVYKF